MKALKRLAASTMLALALVAGGTQTVAAQDSLSCEYVGTDIIITDSAIYIIDYYYC